MYLHVRVENRMFPVSHEITSVSSCISSPSLTIVLNLDAIDYFWPVSNTHVPMQACVWILTLKTTVWGSFVLFPVTAAGYSTIALISDGLSLPCCVLLSSTVDGRLRYFRLLTWKGSAVRSIPWVLTGETGVHTFPRRHIPKGVSSLRPGLYTVPITVRSPSISVYSLTNTWYFLAL